MTPVDQGDSNSKIYVNMFINLYGFGARVWDIGQPHGCNPDVDRRWCASREGITLPEVKIKNSN